MRRLRLSPTFHCKIYGRIEAEFSSMPGYKEPENVKREKNLKKADKSRVWLYPPGSKRGYIDGDDSGYQAWHYYGGGLLSSRTRGKVILSRPFERTAL
ncbi:MAG: hypothetical protein ACLVIY_14660 [Anaerobutyricum soehngenii]